MFPNRVLREDDLLTAEETGVVDLQASEAFVIVDHQVVHVYVDDDALSDAGSALQSLDGVETLLDEVGKREREIDHPNAGDLVLIANEDVWFQYYW